MNPSKVAAIVLGALVLQVSLFARFSYEAARPDIMILVVISAGFVAGADKGALMGFICGLALDVVLTTPFGLSALVYTLVGYTVGAVGYSVLRSSWWIAPAVVALSSALGMLVYALVAELLGLAAFTGPPLTAIVVVVSAVNAALAPIAVRLMRWARSDQADHRRYPFLAR